MLRFANPSCSFRVALWLTLALCLMGQGAAADPPSADMVLARIRSFIATTASAPDRYKIYIYDMLGEGAGHFDSEPRYHATEMNCTTWLQMALAHGYSSSSQEIPAVLDRVRYFYGVPGYGTRKHFTDNWLTLEPAPLKKMDLSSCGPVKTKILKPDYAFFKQNKKYSCALLEEKNPSVTIEYIEPQQLDGCARRLENGVYFIFPVSSDPYIARYGKESGPMGMVHGLIMDVRNMTSGEGGVKAITVHHASITKQRVVSRGLNEYVLGKASSLFAGYTIWGLDLGWDSTASSEIPAAEKTRIDELLRCEKGLVRSRVPGAP